jgi:hypothetical protein
VFFVSVWLQLESHERANPPNATFDISNCKKEVKRNFVDILLQTQKSSTRRCGRFLRFATPTEKRSQINFCCDKNFRDPVSAVLFFAKNKTCLRPSILWRKVKQFTLLRVTQEKRPLNEALFSASEELLAFARTFFEEQT